MDTTSPQNHPEARALFVERLPYHQKHPTEASKAMLTLMSQVASLCREYGISSEITHLHGEPAFYARRSGQIHFVLTCNHRGAIWVKPSNPHRPFDELRATSASHIQTLFFDPVQGEWVGPRMEGELHQRRSPVAVVVELLLGAFTDESDTSG